MTSKIVKPHQPTVEELGRFINQIATVTWDTTGPKGGKVRKSMRGHIIGLQFTDLGWALSVRDAEGENQQIYLARLVRVKLCREQVLDPNAC